MFLDESTVITTSTPDQIELRTDASAPFLVNQSIDGIIPQNPQVNYTYSSIREHTLYQGSATFLYHCAKFQFINPSWATLDYYVLCTH